MKLRVAMLTITAMVLLGVGVLLTGVVSADDQAIPTVRVSSPNPGELSITWSAPENTTNHKDYRVSWSQNTNGIHSYSKENTDTGGNVYPGKTVTSHTVAGLQAGTYYVALRARYNEGSGPWKQSAAVAVEAETPPETETPNQTRDTEEPTSTPAPTAAPADTPTPQSEPVLLSSRSVSVEDHSQGGPIPHVGDRTGSSPGHRNVQTDPWEFRIPDGPGVTVTGLHHAGALSPLYWIVGNTSEQDYSMLLRIEGKDFPMSEATLLEGSKRGQIYYWKDHGLSWQVGGAVVVAVYHLPDAPVVELPSMKLAGAVQDLEMTSTEGGFLDLSWREPENADEVGVEAYEVYVKETDQPWSDARRLVVPRSHGRASTGGASQRNAKNQGTEQQTTRSDGTPGGGNASPDRGRQPLPKSGVPVKRGEDSQEPPDTGRDSEPAENTFKLSVPALQGGTFEARVYPQGTGGLGRDAQSNPVRANPLGSLQTETPDGRVLVGNLRYPPISYEYFSNGRGLVAHSFTTGPKTGGYTIQGIRVPFRVETLKFPSKLTISADNSGRPGDVLHTLNPPDGLSEGFQLAEFTGTNVNLSAKTTYWLTLLGPVGWYAYVFFTDYTDDEPEETGWSIGDSPSLRIIVYPESSTTEYRTVWHYSGAALVLLMEFVEKRGVANSAPAISTAAAINVGENVTQVVKLEATDEYIPDGGLAWAIRAGTDGGADRGKFVLSRDGVLLFGSPKDFEAKDDADSDGVYEVSVQVSDETLTTTQNLQVTLQDTNENPGAAAGADQVGVDEGAAVTLSGTGSDPDALDTAGTLSYRWRQTDGLSHHRVSLVNANTAMATFTAPTGLLEDAMLGFVLTVSDDEGLSTDDEMRVRVTARGPIPEEGLVGNLAQAAGSSLSIDTGGAAYGQAFTTGPVNSRFSGVRLSTAVGDRTTPRVAIHADRSANPSSRLRTLVNPDTLDDDTGTAEEFTTDTLVLQADTTYWVVVTRASGSGAVSLGTAASAAEDASAAAGWTITGTAWQRSGGAWSEVAGSRAVKLAILGEENPYVLGWAVSSRPMSADTYRAGENLELEFTFNEPVVTDNFTRALLWVGPRDRASSFRSARYAWGSGTRKLVFAYKVQERDADDNGFNTDAGFVKASGPVTDHSGEVPANLYVEAGEAGTGHKVNGSGDMGCSTVLCATVTVAQHGDAGTHGAGHHDSGNIGNISNRVFYYQEDNYPEDDLAYVIMEVLVRDAGQLEILLNRPPGQVMMRELRFTVGTEHFPLRGALVHGSRITWRNTELTWTAGDKVSIMVTDHTVVGNLLQDVAGYVSTSSETPALAQSFTTGNNSSGYVLLAASLPVAAYPGAVPTVSVYSDNSGVPGESLHQLSRRVWFWYGSDTPNNYMASDLPLAPNTTYWLVVEKLADKRDITMLVTETADEDPGSASGWSLGDAGQKRSNGLWTPLTGAADTIQMAVLAMPANRPATGAPVIVGVPQANIPVLVDTKGITDLDGLTGATYAYQWMVGDGNGQAEDIPGATGASYVPRSSDMGQRLQVRISFQDDAGNREQLTSPAALMVGVLVSNLDQPVQVRYSVYFNDVWSINSGTKRTSSFTTGSQAGGYALHSLLLRLRGPTATVEIYSDNSGAPGTSQHTLTPPASHNHLEFGTRTYTSSDFTLNPDTTYWVVLGNGGSVYDVEIDHTAFLSEDEGSAPGWSIGNQALVARGGSENWRTERAVAIRPVTVRMAVLAE